MWKVRCDILHKMGLIEVSLFPLQYCKWLHLVLFQILIVLLWAKGVSRPIEKAKNSPASRMLLKPFQRAWVWFLENCCRGRRKPWKNIWRHWWWWPGYHQDIHYRHYGHLHHYHANDDDGQVMVKWGGEDVNVSSKLPSPPLLLLAGERNDDQI